MEAAAYHASVIAAFTKWAQGDESQDKLPSVLRDEVLTVMHQQRDALAPVEMGYAFIRDVVNLGRQFGIDFLWHVDDGAVVPSVNCSDLFWWGTADAEEVTPENIAVLRQAGEALRALPRFDGEFVDLHIEGLFACRVRKMRPQGACYESYWPELAALFDACGPEREPPTTMGNTPRRQYVPMGDRHKRHKAENDAAKDAEILRLRAALEVANQLTARRRYSRLEEHLRAALAPVPPRTGETK